MADKDFRIKDDTISLHIDREKREYCVKVTYRDFGFHRTTELHCYDEKSAMQLYDAMGGVRAVYSY